MVSCQILAAVPSEYAPDMQKSTILLLKSSPHEMSVTVRRRFAKMSSFIVNKDTIKKYCFLLR